MDNELRLKELERRRKRAARLLKQGIHDAEVARRVGATRTSVLRWRRRLEQDGMEGLARAKDFGRPRTLTEEQLKELATILKGGTLAVGYATEMWTLPRIAAVIKERFGVELSEPSVWRNLRAMGWSVQRPAKQARQRNEKAIRTWKRKRWPELKK